MGAAATAPRLQPLEEGEVRFGHAARVWLADGVNEFNAEVPRDGAEEHLLGQLPLPRLGARPYQRQACCPLSHLTLLAHRQEELHSRHTVHALFTGRPLQLGQGTGSDGCKGPSLSAAGSCMSRKHHAMGGGHLEGLQPLAILGQGRDGALEGDGVWDAALL